jgi:hypothetical protein
VAFFKFPFQQVLGVVAFKIRAGRFYTGVQAAQAVNGGKHGLFRFGPDRGARLAVRFSGVYLKAKGGARLEGIRQRHVQPEPPVGGDGYGSFYGNHVNEYTAIASKEQ